MAPSVGGRAAIFRFGGWECIDGRRSNNSRFRDLASAVPTGWRTEPYHTPEEPVNFRLPISAESTS